MLVAPVGRSKLIAVLRRVAMTCGAFQVRNWERSSSKVTSRTHWSRLSGSAGACCAGGPLRTVRATRRGPRLRQPAGRVGICSCGSVLCAASSSGCGSAVGPSMSVRRSDASMTKRHPSGFVAREKEKDDLTETAPAAECPVMRLGMVTQWYDPEGGAAMTFGVIARALHGLDHEVDVLTGFPNYPAGRLHPDYRLRPYLRETREGVTVHRAPLFVSHDANPFRRAVNYASFGASSTALSLKTLGRSDAVLVVLSPPFAAFPALNLKRLRGIPFGVQIQDLWPQSVTAGGMLSPGRAAIVERGIHALCDRVYRHASFIAVTSPGMADVISSRGVPDSKITFVSNWANEDYFHPLLTPANAPDLGPRRPFTVMYAGAMGEVQGLAVVLEAAELLRDNVRIGFLLVGGGVAEAGLKDAVRRRGLVNVSFAPPQPAGRMAEVLSQGDVQLICLRDLPVFANTLPSKLPATLAAGRPIIGAIGGDAARVVMAANAGEVVTPGSASQLADAVLRASLTDPATLARWGQSGRRYYETELSAKIGARKLADLLRQAAVTTRRLRPMNPRLPDAA